MKKSLLISPMLIALFAFGGSALANEELPIDMGIVIDVYSETPPTSEPDNTVADVGTDQPIPTVVESPVQDTTVVDQGTTLPIEPAVTTTPATDDTTTSSADGTVLPIDPGDVNTVETSSPVTSPEQDKVVLTEGAKVEEPKVAEPVVQALPKTGIEDNALLYSALALLLGMVAFFTTRRKTVNN